MSAADCEHENMVDDEPIFTSGSEWVGHGYRCVDCGFQTLTTSTYTPIDKPCPNCGVTFEGMDDVPEELCLACAKVNLDAFLERYAK